jgi:hypothetical protein
MGIDICINFLNVASTTDKKIKVFCQLINEKQEKHLMKDVNYFITKAIEKFAVENGISVIGLKKT